MKQALENRRFSTYYDIRRSSIAQALLQHRQLLSPPRIREVLVQLSPREKLLEALASLKGCLHNEGSESCFQARVPEALGQILQSGQSEKVQCLALQCLVSLTYSDRFGKELADSLQIYDSLIGLVQGRGQARVLALWVVANLCGSNDCTILKQFFVRGLLSSLAEVLKQELDSRMVDALLWLLSNLFKEGSPELDHDSATLSQLSLAALFCSRIIDKCSSLGEDSYRQQVERSLFVLAQLYKKYPLNPLAVKFDALASLCASASFGLRAAVLLLTLLKSRTGLFLVEHGQECAGLDCLLDPQSEEHELILAQVRAVLVNY